MKHLAICLSALCVVHGSHAAPPAEPDLAPAWGERIEWGDAGPSAREHASVFTFGDQVVVYAGSGYEPQGQPLADAWAYSIETRQWTELRIEGEASTLGGSKRVAQAPGAASAYIFGGYGAGFAPSNQLHRVAIKDDALVFTSIEQVTPPPARALHAFAFDPGSDRFVVSCGVSPQAVYDDTWIGEFDEQGRVVWREIEGGPSARFGFPFGFDTDSGELVLLSGQAPPTQEAPMAMNDDGWVLRCRGDAPVWERIDLDDPPTGRRNPTFVYDDRADRLVVWCGTADGRTNVEDIVVVERDDHGAWVVATWEDEPEHPRRSSGFGFVAPESGRCYLGFGNSAVGRYRDWVVLNTDQAGQD